MSEQKWFRSVGISIAVVLVLVVVGVVYAEIPKSINYQGKLTGSAGEPLAGSHDMTFGIYAAPSGGSELWSETKSEVSDSAGVFATVLGSDRPIDIPFSDPCWLEIAVDGEILSPRREITSVAFAFRSLRADSLGGFGPDRFVQQGQINSVTTLMIVDGTLTDADISGSAAIDPTKIAGGAWTQGNDGAGSGLDADMVDGLHEAAFADSNHNHDLRYYTETELNTTGSLNNASNPVDWTRLKSVPAGFADGTDDVGGTGDGYSLDAADGSPTDVVYVDNSGNVGVGTTAPKCLLDVHKGSSGYAASLAGTSLLVESNSQANIKLLSPNGSFQSITFGAPTNPAAGWIAYDHDEQRLRLGADDGDRLTIAKGGYVGIGTSEPASELHLAKNVNAPVEITLTNESTGPLSSMGLLFSDEETDAGLRVYDDEAASYPEDLLIFNGHDRGHIVFETMTQEAVTIDSAGRVGIGTYLPEQQLHVQSYGDTYARIETRRTSGTAGLVLANDGPGWEIDLRGDMSDAFLIYGGTGGWPRFLIDTNGKVGIGTTSPGNLLHVYDNSSGGLSFPLKLDNPGIAAGTAAGILFKVDGGESGRGKGAIVYERTDTWNRGDFHILQGTGTGTSAPVTLAEAVMTIKNNGRVGIGTKTPANQLHVKSANTSCGIEVESNLTDGIAALVLANDARAWTLTTEGTFGDGFMITDPGVGYRALFIDTNHNMGISTTAPTARLDVNGATGYDQFRMRTSFTPSTSADVHGNVGDMAWDANFVYVKTAAGWKRAALSTF
ncbi:MAG: hypothetical protein V1694_07330 [Candidatus Eisenbacteria bacterium]